jgi:hypothetical protein
VAIDLSKLLPGDAVAALRSYPRRYRSALSPIDDDESIEEIGLRAGPDGRSAVEVAADTARSWALQREALRQIQLDGDPVLHKGVVDASERQWQSPVHETVASVLEQLDDGATELADAVGSLSTDDWQRRVTVAGGPSVTALDVVREAVRVGHDNLGDVERTLDAVRR